MLSIFLIWSLHFGVMSMMSIDLFSWIGVVGWIALIPSAVWEWPATRTALGALEPLRAPLRSRVDKLFAPAPALDGPGNPVLASTASLLAVAGLATTLYLNIASLPVLKERLPPLRGAPIAISGMDQVWAMFSQPMTMDGWFLAPGSLASGAQIDLLQDGAPLSDRRPTGSMLSIRGDRWRKLLTNLLPEDATMLRQALAQMYCSRWNSTHMGPERLREVEIVFMEEALFENGSRNPPRRISLIQKSCGQN
jgi:hypothetical protein